MFDINGTYTIVVNKGEVTSVKKDGVSMKKTDDMALPPRLRSQTVTMYEDEQLPNEVSGCINLSSVIDDPTAKCELKWGKWW